MKMIPALLFAPKRGAGFEGLGRQPPPPTLDIPDSSQIDRNRLRKSMGQNWTAMGCCKELNLSYCLLVLALVLSREKGDTILV